MTDTARSTDTGIGLPLIFGVLAALGVLVMVIGAGDDLAGYGFAGAVGFASLTVLAIHLYG